MFPLATVGSSDGESAEPEAVNPLLANWTIAKFQKQNRLAKLFGEDGVYYFGRSKKTGRVGWNLAASKPAALRLRDEAEVSTAKRHKRHPEP